jgi:tripartite-type tricarboxylate transporter receptor subunit TctC
MTRTRMTLLCLSAALLAPMQVQAQANYPNKPITLVVPYAPGNTDIIARIYLNQVGKDTKWPFTYDYKPGAAGHIGANVAARATPDGYTMLMISSSLTFGHLLKNKPAYDWRTDLIPTYQLTATSLMLMVNANHPAKSIKEYVAWAKANPGKLNYGVVGTGGITHLVGMLMHEQMGIEVNYVPYKGFGPVATDLAAGVLHAAMPSYKAVYGLINEGKIRPLGMSMAKARNKSLPNLKSVAEEGYPDFNYISWMGIFFPKGTPPAVMSRMNAELNKATKAPEVIKGFDDLGDGIGGGTPEEFKKVVLDTSERLSKIIIEKNIDL